MLGRKSLIWLVALALGYSVGVHGGTGLAEDAQSNQAEMSRNGCNKHAFTKRGFSKQGDEYHVRTAIGGRIN